ncbi:MAG: hypothetical protein ACRYFU_22640, partial [Janthinobacterium lividum]
MNSPCRTFASTYLPSRSGRIQLIFGVLGLTLLGGQSAAAQGLQVSYGSKGVQTLSYNGLSLENTGVFSGDTFHIWHMKSTDLSGNVVSSGQYGWGENNNGESWNSQTNTETYSFSWGSISTQFVQSGNNLNIIVTETNYAGSGVIFDGADISPLALHFPIDPIGFSGYTQYAVTTTDPAVSVADFGVGVVTSVIPNESQALYGGWRNLGTNTYNPLMTGTPPDGLATFLPRNDLPLQPGNSLSYTVSLRFTNEGTAANATDAYSSFASAYPSQVTWTDKRIIGTAYLASSPSGADVTQPGGYPTNPRRYFNDASVNIYTASGLQTFQDRLLTQAAADVTNAQNMSAQGVITWDLEGEQYPQTTSYVCSPDQIATVAPEMESVITDGNSPFYGKKLDDAYFKTLTNAGLRVGLCLRPQQFVLASNGTASQNFLSGNAAIIANLENKARYANTRWGATLFYVDSTVDANGGTLDPAIFQQLATDLPTFLFMPEESNTRYYAYTAPFYSFIFHTTLGTAAAVYNVYPKAFGANLVNDVAASTLATYTPQLTQSVERGDILMGHADFWQANDPTLVSIYRTAGVTGPVTSPVTLTKPAITWPSPTAITYGTALSSAQLDAVANVAGSFSYSAAQGTVLNAGTTTLSATFTPTNTAAYTSATASVTLTVTAANPTLSWSTPAAINAGTALSSAQLNATANVAGSFSYSPAAGTVLGSGSNQLTATFTPSSSNYNSATANVSLYVNPAVGKTTPSVSWATPASIVYGTSLSSVQLNATASVAGSVSYSPAAGTVLGAGAHTVTAVFTPSNTSLYNGVTTTRTVTVTQATPAITWSAPAAIPSGTALSATQLNATANVAGSFAYSPGLGTVLNAGSTTLTAVFTPTDSTDFTTQTKSVSLVVNAASQPSSPVTILSPGAGASVSGVITVLGQINLNLDPAGSFLMVDGSEVGTRRVTGGPYLYTLD